MNLSDLYNRLKALFPLGELTEQRPALAFITLPAEFLRPTLRHLRDREGFTHLVLPTAVDRIQEGRFPLMYLVTNRTQVCDIDLRLMIDRLVSDIASHAAGASLDVAGVDWVPQTRNRVSVRVEPLPASPMRSGGCSGRRRRG